MVTDVLPRNLALRSTVARLFERDALRGGDAELDFAGIESMGRSFAHEYLQLKSAHPHGVAEVNVPDDVEKMLEVAKNAKPMTDILAKKKVLAEPIPLVAGM